MKPTISIAMAAYNGAAYLQEQLDSLAAQTRLPDELVVCDDGSTDDTVNILEEFAARAPFAVHIHRNEFNLGYADNFFAAARLCTGGWIAFCDQDDVWLPNKLADCEEVVSRNPDTIMVLQNAELCDADLQLRNRLFPNSIKPGVYGPFRQHGFWVWPGFVKTINASIISELSNSARPLNYNGDRTLQTHDKWTCMVANALGGIVVLKRPAALYRRHDSTVTGDYRPRPFSEKVGKSVGVGAERYSFLQSVAQSCAGYFECEAVRTDRPAWRSRFSEASIRFRQLGSNMALRAELYDSSRHSQKLRTLLKMLRKGTYFGDPFVALGWRSAMKDLAFSLLPNRRSQTVL